MVSNPSEPLSKNDLKQIWQPYIRKDKSRHKSGNGLGLSIVKSILELHGVKYEMTMKDNKVEFRAEFWIKTLYGEKIRQCFFYFIRKINNWFKVFLRLQREVFVKKRKKTWLKRKKIVKYNEYSIFSGFFSVWNIENIISDGIVNPE